MLQPCERCDGRVMVDRAFCNYGHVEVFCIICGWRAEYHRNDPRAIAINKIERAREYALNGFAS